MEKQKAPHAADIYTKIRAGYITYIPTRNREGLKALTKDSCKKTS